MTIEIQGADTLLTVLAENAEGYRAHAKEPVRIVKRNGLTRLFVGETELPYAIVRDSISVKPKGKYNHVTLTIVLGDVEMVSE